MQPRGVASTRSLFFAVAVIVESLAVVSCEGILEREAQRLTGAVAELESAFPPVVRAIYWNNRQLAEQLIKSPGHEAEAKELLNMAQVSAYIEAVKYAIRMRALSAVGQMITSRFEEQENGGLLDTKLQVVMRPELVSAMVSRALLRGLADCDRYTTFNWGWLHKLIEHNLPLQQNPAFKKLAVDSYHQLIKLDLDTKQANSDFQAEFRNALKALGIEETHAANIVAVLDRMIDEALGCTQCAGLGVDASRFQTRTLFPHDEAVLEAVNQFVDDELTSSFSEIQGVYTITPEEQAAVSKADIGNLMQKTIA